MIVPRCEDCVFRKGYDCRRNPPVVIPTGYENQPETRWPYVLPDEFCGEFKHK